MERHNKIAVVTGASAGIGAATCKALVEKGMIVVGLARRLQKMETQTRPLIHKKYQTNFHCCTCDVADEESVKKAFAWIENKFGGIDVLINNAGIYSNATSLVASDNSEVILNTLNTNVLGVVWCTREAFRNMKQRHCNGHVILINSVAGHKVINAPDFVPNIYAPSKYAITAMTEVLRQEFSTNQTTIKVTSISPGIVHTEIMGEHYEELPGTPFLNSEDIADAVVYCIQTPPHVQIHEMIIKPVVLFAISSWKDLHRNNVSVCILQKLKEDPLFSTKILFSDEASSEMIWLNGNVIKQNYRVWAEEQPEEFLEVPLYPEKTTVWCGLWAGGIIGPYFFKNDDGRNVTVNGARYRAMISDVLLPEIEVRNLDGIWFQQDGATCHTAAQTMDLLRGHFEERLISRLYRLSRPRRLCDITPLDFFLWGYVKYAEKPITIQVEMLERVIQKWTLRMDTLRRSCGQHLKEILFKK